MAEMPYRRLGRAGVKVSVLSFGSWVTFKNQLDRDAALECMQTAFDAGVNFFDNAEAYARGESERYMGEALQKLGWDRRDYLVSTKFYWGLRDTVNASNTLNRKYLLDAMERSLERLQLDHVDLIFCHRPDPDTPVEETVWAMSDLVSRGHAVYWGTSEWSADEIRAAYEVAQRHHLHAPVMEQPQYHLLHRERVEEEYARLYEDIGLGLTTWSPLASGLLTGKYLEGVPEGSRAEKLRSLRGQLTDEEANQRVRNLNGVAEELGCSLSQLAIAWCASNPRVSTVITGASRVEQLRENLGALEVLEALDDEVKARIDEALGVD